MQKGTLTNQEAEEIRAKLEADSAATLFSSIAKGKATQFLTFSGRLQAQYAGIDSNGAGLSATNHFFLRRIYIGMDAALTQNWSASFNYDFAGASFDKAFLNWSNKISSQDISFDIGLRKVNYGYEETMSSGSLDAIERSAVTRYFVEDANGRRMGAGSYRIGLYLDGNKSAAAGKTTGLFYGAAITNPERVTGTGSDVGNRITNTFAYWGNIGYSAKINSASLVFGGGFGYLPGQGGRIAAASYTTESRDLIVGSVYGAFTWEDFTLRAEVMFANSEHDLKAVGSAAGRSKDSTPWGFWIQPSYKLNENIEFVVRYSYLDSDGRGVRVGDCVRSAPAALTAEAVHEYYAGVNYYFAGNDIKFQIGYVGGRGTRSGHKAETVNGIRSQFQINF